MVISRIGGVTGKPCSVCGVWKRLSEYPADKGKGKFATYRQTICHACLISAKIKKDKDKSNE